MKLSIVTINYNNAEGLRKTLASVAAQTYSKIEHIIIDGGSTDNSVDIIKEYVRQVESEKWKEESVIWSCEKDKGIYDAMNKGVKKATGDYVWILNSGDAVAAPDVVERMIASLEIGNRTLENGIDILLGNIVRVYENKKEYAPLPKAIDDRGIDNRLTPRPIDVSMLTFYSATIPQDAAFVRRELFEKYGFFDDKLKICSDWKLYLNMMALGGVQPMYVNIDVVLFDMTGISNENHELRLVERKAYLEEVLPASVIKDYEAYAFPIHQYQRLKKYHLWGLTYFIERVLFKLEKWHILK